MTNKIELFESTTIVPFKTTVWNYDISKKNGVMSEVVRKRLTPMVILSLVPDTDENEDERLFMDAQEVKELYRALKKALKQAKKMAPLPDDED
jgi:hypothetical protein